MGTTSELPIEQVPLFLDRSTNDNYYAEFVVQFYGEALAAHERGDDLEQFLRSLTFPGQEYGLVDQTIAFVCDSKNASSDTSDYTMRLGFALAEKDKFFPAPPKKPIDQRYSDFRKQITGRKGDPYSSTIGFMEMMDKKDRAKSFVGADLDSIFDTDGRRLGQLDEIHQAMANFSISVDEPELATYFIDQLADSNRKIDLYFKTIFGRNSAEIRTQQWLADLPGKLEAEPEKLCEFLVREIAELGSKFGVDVQRNMQTVMTLTGDPRLFSLSLQEVVSRHMDKQPVKDAQWIRYELAKALLRDGQDGLARQAIASFAQEAYFEDMTASETLQCDGWIIRAEQGRLTRKDRLRLRNLTTNVKWPQSHSAYLALAIAGSEKRFSYRKQNGNLGYGRAIEYIENNPLYFDTRYYNQRPEEIRAYRTHFPLASAKWGDYPTKIQCAVDLGDHNSADELFYELAENQRLPALTKLLGAITVASSYKERPAIQLELEARVAAEIEILGIDLGSPKNYETVAERSTSDQAIAARVKLLRDRVNQLHSESIRSTYHGTLDQFLASQSGLDNSVARALSILSIRT